MASLGFYPCYKCDICWLAISILGVSNNQGHKCASFKRNEACIFFILEMKVLILFTLVVVLASLHGGAQAKPNKLIQKRGKSAWQLVSYKASRS